MHWLCLAGAIALEIAGCVSVKLSQGFTRPIPSTLLFVFYALSFAPITIAVKKIDVSVSYAIWSGAGTAAIALIGVLWFRETLKRCSDGQHRADHRGRDRLAGWCVALPRTAFSGGAR